MVILDQSKTFWQSLSSKAKLVTILCTAVTALITTSIATAHVMELAKPYWIATHGHVAEEIKKANDPITLSLKASARRQIETRLQIANGDRGRIRDKVADKELLLRQSPDIPLPIRAAIEEQIRNWTVDMDLIERAIGRLETENNSH
jgi:hypothetical protein